MEITVQFHFSFNIYIYAIIYIYIYNSFVASNKYKLSQKGRSTLPTHLTLKLILIVLSSLPATLG